MASNLGSTQTNAAVPNGLSPYAIFFEFPGGFKCGISQQGMQNLERLGLFLLLGLMIWLTLGDSVANTVLLLRGDVSLLADRVPPLLERMALALERSANQ